MLFRSDLWTGANFKLKIRKVDGYQNYDLAEFDSAGPLFDDDEKLEKIWKSQYSLLELLEPKNFKSYADLESRLKRVLGQSNQTKYKTAEDYTAKSLDEAEDEAFVKASVEKKTTASFAKSDVPFDVEEDDDMDYFSKLINED